MDPDQAQLQQLMKALGGQQEQALQPNLPNPYQQMMAPPQYRGPQIPMGQFPPPKMDPYANPANSGEDRLSDPPRGIGSTDLQTNSMRGLFGY